MTVFCMQVYFLAFLFWFSLSISFARVVQHKMWTDKARSMQTDKSTSHEHCTMHLGLWKSGTTCSWLKELLHVLPWPFQSALPPNLSCPWIDLYHLYSISLFFYFFLLFICEADPWITDHCSQISLRIFQYFLSGKTSKVNGDDKWAFAKLKSTRKSTLRVTRWSVKNRKNLMIAIKRKNKYCFQQFSRIDGPILQMIPS